MTFAIAFDVAVSPLHFRELAIEERAVWRQRDGPLVGRARLIEAAAGSSRTRSVNNLLDGPEPKHVDPPLKVGQ